MSIKIAIGLDFVKGTARSPFVSTSMGEIIVGNETILPENYNISSFEAQTYYYLDEIFPKPNSYSGEELTTLINQSITEYYNVLEDWSCASDTERAWLDEFGKAILALVYANSRPGSVVVITKK